MLSTEMTSALSRRGALAGFPGIPIWIFGWIVLYISWKIADAARPTRPDWSDQVWIWIAVGYGLQIIGVSFAILLPRCVNALAGRPTRPSLNVWVSAYSWPLGIVVTGMLLFGIPDEPEALDWWAVAATIYCFAVDLDNKRNLTRMARGTDSTLYGRRG